MRKILAPVAAVLAVALAFTSVSVAGDKDKEGKQADAQTAAAKSTAKVGESAPAFSLQSTDGKTVSLSDFAGKPVVLEWVNPECPFVVRHYNLDTMSKTADKHKDAQWVRIATGGSADADKLKAWASKENVTGPILLDSDGKVGKAYGAKTTPHMYIIDKDGKLVYAGGIDSDAEGDPAAPMKADTTNYVDTALAQLASGQAIEKAETKAYGCGVKYKK